ncbi:MAG: hypothetical protein AABY10_00070 [Nanoarchaeota archaeon]
MEEKQEGNRRIGSFRHPLVVNRMGIRREICDEEYLRGGDVMTLQTAVETHTKRVADLFAWRIMLDHVEIGKEHKYVFYRRTPDNGIFIISVCDKGFNVNEEGNFVRLIGKDGRGNLEYIEIEEYNASSSQHEQASKVLKSRDL